MFSSGTIPLMAEMMNFVLHGGRHLHQMLFQKRRRGGENQSVRIFDYFVDIRVEFDFVSIKFDGGKIAGVMSQQQKLFYLVWPTHIPVNTILCRKYNLGQGGSQLPPPIIAIFPGNLHSITLIWLRLQSMPLLSSAVGVFAIPVCIFLFISQSSCLSLLGLASTNVSVVRYPALCKAGTHASSIPSATYLSAVSFLTVFSGRICGKSNTS